MKIKAGYRITVVSWENDGDNYRTKTVDGLDEATARYHVDLLKLLSNNKFGNMYDPSTEEIDEFRAEIIKVMEAHNQISEEAKYSFDHALEDVGEYTGYGEDFYTRVVERIAVEYVPQEIELEDVSSKFGI